MGLCRHIKEFYDYFVYPIYTRDNNSITRFYEYYRCVKEDLKISLGTTENEKIYKLMNDEFDNDSDIYTRIFIDKLTNEIIIPGYVLKARFFEEPRIMKFVSEKSKKAIYYVFHMEYGEDILKIDSNKELWEWDKKIRKNFGGNEPAKCPHCNTNLKLMDFYKKSKFLYVCEKCTTNQWFEMIDIHKKNMGR